ncbi:hypothetical protein JZ751_004134 [Albula glossodonta]|uniref:Uncharacterized protein n=1 Tax=Albula glossodonta TaxID=121402 RepID=A0A8T2P6B9_9TELE|nr:hypothetical protein JZ751_004134 [Albula glossodonta]
MSPHSEEFLIVGQQFDFCPLVVGPWCLQLITEQPPSPVEKECGRPENEADSRRDPGEVLSPESWSSELPLRCASGLSLDREWSFALLQQQRNLISFEGSIPTGLPGTGKILQARATTGQANVPFITVKVPRDGCGHGASQGAGFIRPVRTPPASCSSPRWTPWDKSGGREASGAWSEQENALSQLLVEMDAMDKDLLAKKMATLTPGFSGGTLLQTGFWSMLTAF